VAGVTLGDVGRPGAGGAAESAATDAAGALGIKRGTTNDDHT